MVNLCNRSEESSAELIMKNGMLDTKERARGWRGIQSNFPPHFSYFSRQQRRKESWLGVQPSITNHNLIRECWVLTMSLPFSILSSWPYFTEELLPLLLLHTRKRGSIEVQYNNKGASYMFAWCLQTTYWASSSCSSNTEYRADLKGDCFYNG